VQKPARLRYIRGLPRTPKQTTNNNVGAVIVGMLQRFGLQVNDVFVYSVHGYMKGEGARLNVFRNPYIAHEIKVIDGCNKSNYTVIFHLILNCMIVLNIKPICIILVFCKTCLIQWAPLNHKGHL
jgi:hypothetical protein